MIDYIKIALKGDKYKDQFLGNESYGFEQMVDIHHGELRYPLKGKYENMRIDIFKDIVVIHGSLHKLYNQVRGNGEQNYTDFYIRQIKEAIGLLESTFEINSEDAIIQNMEVGVNIIISKPASDFLKENLILYKWNEPTGIEDFKGKGHFREFEMTQYFLKIYDKGKQFGVSDNLLRLELKSKKSQFFTRASSRLYLYDLARIEVLRHLGQMLGNSVNKLLVCDDFDSSDIKDIKDRTSLLEYRNPSYWSRKSGFSNPRARSRKREMFHKLMKMHSLDNLYLEIQAKVKDKVNNLIQANESLVS